MPIANLSAEVIIYGGKESEPYHLDLLKLALSYNTDKRYQVYKHQEPLPKQRAFKFMEQNTGVDVLSGSATKERQAQYRAIHVPLYKGLKGWRLAIINQHTPDLFKQVKNIKQLAQLNPTQFHSWIASKVFKHNKINVATSSSFKGLFQMIDRKRADYLPRSLLEVEKDLARYPELNLTLDPYILIKYPSVSYFFVNKHNKTLANHIEQGLKKALKDGNFDRLFNQTFGKVIKQYNLENRNVIELENPFYYDPRTNTGTNKK
ncbi:transporter substrate-binding domain-containing protein [Algibacillus agarilyticus]|uniref:transporter substrate-binding domain-containing protein n=1 Tax=Algibacillus agarilyticus TaxID=2234133 RepID=UPI000DD0CAA7|nr:transporter substrate-binding domain-containing protein [Algibacillus agarilyticus]